MANFQSQPPAGRQLPNNWAAVASVNAAQANAAYQYQLENAWRQPLQAHPLGIMKSARLEQQQPAPPKRNDARSDTRTDSTMTLIRDDSFEQIWQDSTGAIVKIRKQRK